MAYRRALLRPIFSACELGPFQALDEKKQGEGRLQECRSILSECHVCVREYVRGRTNKSEQSNSSPERAKAKQLRAHLQAVWGYRLSSTTV